MSFLKEIIRQEPWEFLENSWEKLKKKQDKKEAERAACFLFIPILRYEGKTLKLQIILRSDLMEIYWDLNKARV